MSVLNRPERAASTALPPHMGRRGIDPEQVLVLQRIPFSSYVAISDAIGDQPRTRCTYEGGTLEIMTTFNLHELYKDRISRFLSQVLDEVGCDYVCGGSQTFRDGELERGFEPGTCFWTANCEKVRAPFFLWHPDHQPPPDLVVEIEVTHSALDKLKLLAACKIPEVWRFDGENLSIHTSNATGESDLATASPTFPLMPMDEALPFIGLDGEREGRAFNRAVRAWV